MWMVVCAACFEDEDIKAHIVSEGDEPGCDFCGEDDAPTMDFETLADFMRTRLLLFWSRAIDELMYDDESESGYGGDTWTTDEILFDELQLELPRDNDGSLRSALITSVSEERWCDLDPARLPPEEGLVVDWEKFSCRAMRDGDAVLKITEPEDEYDDSTPPGLVLPHLAAAVDRLGLIAVWPAGYHLFRARPRCVNEHFTRPEQLGPPPIEFGTQSNRMNAAGNPMFYGSERAETCVVEASAERLSIGLFSVERELRLLDLAELPAAPGVFSSEPADDIRTLWFLHRFASLISRPVVRVDDFVPEYVPTQVMTSFLRLHPFKNGQIDGIRYRSAATSESNERPNANVAIFATSADVQIDNDAGASRAYLRVTAVFQYPEERVQLLESDDAGVRSSQRRPWQVRGLQLEPLPLFDWTTDDVPRE